MGAYGRRIAHLVAAATAAWLLFVPALAQAQPPPRRLATIASLREFPGFFHLQNVLLRGEFKETGGRISLQSDDGDLRAVMESNVRTTSGPVEVRGVLVDVGRLEPGDPRVPDAESRDASRWPRPGEEVVVRITAVTSVPASPPLSIRTLALDPGRFQGQKVTVTGNFRGRNLFGDLPGAPGKSRYDFVLRGAEGAIWVTGLQPRGSGFDLDVDRRLDTNQWLEVTGVVAYERGLVRIDAVAFASAKPPDVIAQADEPATPPPSIPPLEVVFSTPTPREDEVSATTTVRIQFSRGLDQRTIPGAIKVSYPGSNTPAPRFQATYDGGIRALTLKFASPLEPGEVRVDVADTLKSFDGAPVAPWSLTFTVIDPRDR